jgi:putative Holliday junction resolvase
VGRRRVLGLDWGEKRTGIAVSDDRAVLAVGYDVWPTADVLSQLARVVTAEEIATIVVGYPLTLRGESGPQARQVDAFIRRLRRRGFAVRRWDERYTTQDASRALSELGISQRKQRGKLDMSAAVLMLQSYLDAARCGSGDPGGE